MIILSAGMPRAGSGWYFNLTNDLLLANGAVDVRKIRKRYHLQNILTEVNCNIGVLSFRRVFSVLIPSLLGNTFVIKAHSSPGSFASFVIRHGQIRPIYIYRDPRDAMLSAMENGQRANARGRPNAFSPIAEFSAALNYMARYLPTWEAWSDLPQTLLTRYENLLLDYDTEASRLLKYLDLDDTLSINQAVIENYRPERAKPDQKGLHFRHGKIGRFRDKMSLEQQEIMNERLGPYLERMGYSI